MKKLSFALLIFVIILEFLLQITGLYSTYNEKTMNVYVYKYRIHINRWFHTWVPNKIVTYKQPEFSYKNSYNDLGHREINFSDLKKNLNTFKIICLGDSFTEGDGAPYDSTWVKQLDRKLNKGNKNIDYSLYNAGVCGSDVIYNQKILFEKLIESQPDLVIECVNNSDIQDLIFRGGLERFNKDSTTTSKVGPKWESIYKFSHVFRALTVVFGGYDKNLIKRKNKNENERKAIKLISHTISSTAQFCLEQNIKYKAIIHPIPYEIKTNTKVLSLQPTENIIDIDSKLKVFYTNHSIDNYFWNLNGHFNGKGYLVMGDIIYDELLKHDSLIFENSL